MEKITKKTLTADAAATTAAVQLRNTLPQLCDLTPRAFQQTEVTGVGHAADAVALRNIYVTAMARTSGVAAAKRGELYTILQTLEKHKDQGDTDTKNHYLDLVLRIRQHLQLN
jgi:hypothetical protein